MEKAKKYLSAAVAGLALYAVSSSALAERVLQGASFAPYETTWGEPAKIFYDKVNEIGKGVLKIRLLGPDAMPATEQPNALRTGVLDIISTPPGMYKHIVPEANAQDLSNLTLEEQRESGAYEELQKITLERLGAHMLTTFGPGVPFHLYLSEEIDSEDQMEGLRVRSQPIFQPFLSSLQMNTSTVPIPDVYTALERGIVQGYAFAGWGIQDLGWDSHTEVRVEPGFYNVVINVLISDKVYSSLNEDEKSVLFQAAEWFDKWWPEYRDKQSKLHQAAQDEAGIKAVDFGEKFATQAENIYWEILEGDNPQTIPSLREKLQSN